MLIIAFTWLVNIPSHIFPCYLNTHTTPQICRVCCPNQPRLSGAYSATLTAPPCQIWVKKNFLDQSGPAVYFSSGNGLKWCSHYMQMSMNDISINTQQSFSPATNPHLFMLLFLEVFDRMPRTMCLLPYCGLISIQICSNTRGAGLVHPWN